MARDYVLGIGVTDEHADLAASVAAFAERHLTPQVRRAAVEAKPTLPEFWKPLADQGLLGLHLAERFGGQDGGLLELAVALEVIGRSAAPGPYVPTVLLSAILSQVADPAAEALLPGLADGSVPGAVGWESGLTGRADGDAIVVSGSTGPILGADLAGVLLVPVQVDDAVRWVLLDSVDVRVKRVSPVDVTRAANPVVVDDVRTDRVLRDLDSGTVHAIAAVVLGAEAVGLTSWCVQTAAEYAVTREQFGRLIGQFQGVKHRCAAMLIGLEKARAVVWDAAQAVDQNADNADFATAIAASTAPDVAVTTARDCVQVLGGIGFTWEHDAHLFYRRALTIRGLLGRSRDARQRVARLALDGTTRPVHIPLPPEAEHLRGPIAAELAEIAKLAGEAQTHALGDNGWVMPHLPKPFGRAAGPVEQLVIAEEIKKSGVRLPELALAAWLMPSVAQHGTDQQRTELVAPTLRGEIFWCQLFSEPGAGSDLASLRTEAVKVDGGWQVTGQKIWTSFAYIAEWGVLLARTDKSVPKHQGISYFVVRMDSPGVTVRQLREMSGGALFSEVFFDNVFIPDSGLIGEPGEGWQVARGTLQHERVALGKGNPMYATVKDLIAFAQAHEDADLSRVGELVSDNQALQLLNGRAVLNQLRGADASAAAAVGKFLNMGFGQQVADFCHAELGASGLADELAGNSDKWIEQTLASRAMTIYGGTTEIQLNVIGERVLGLPRDPQPGE
nr:acyl-CoA dehydrogenase [Kibdelosporangium sp. MJ126-NF4]CEL15575.1 Butyryl-CoA dehydrogenase [Kibdelosporangium sp. MJ126-NF4]CTQ98239.1 Butyryl-CoA dehydrogenase (EC 1.3.99.2) [Kibdelosporangium sp. MJ126-NF4]